MRLFLLAVIFCIPFLSYSQQWCYSAMGEALGGAVGCCRGLSSIGCNPAGIAGSGFCAGIDYNSRFCTKELSQKSVRMAAPVYRGTASAQVCYYGFRLYNTTRASLGYALPLGKRFAAGINLSYSNIHVDDSPQRSIALSGDFGLVCSLSDSWSMQASVLNMANSQYSDCDTIIPCRIQIGAMRSFPGGHSLSLDLAKESLCDPIILHVGAVAHLCGCINAMAGFRSHPSTVGVGLGVMMRNITFQFSVRYSAYVGSSPSASLMWESQNKKNVPLLAD